MGFLQATNEFYLDSSKTVLDKNKLLLLRERLKNIKPSDLQTLDDHQAFISLLGKFRSAIAETAALNGENFNATLASLLAVGADGLYHNDLRFLFELIQNVDDCLYADPSDCELSIHFDFNGGTITLEYNELGFTPENVFSITGIAEAAKNISPDKIEIGEKGIGFKSVFGVADKVLVQSGLFSFMLYENNFTVPQERYEDFTGVKGTRLTLYLKTLNPEGKSEHDLLLEKALICRSIYHKLVNEYCNKNALFNKNSILFLNKLTKIKLYFDVFDSLEFTVSKGLDKTVLPNGVEREDGVVISSVMSSRDRHIQKQATTITCTRYTMPILFSRGMCVSRYGSTTAFPEKKMALQVVIPNSEFISDVGTGSLYSFLPTQVKTSVPISCHIPFKLDSSRENVDSQGKNAWFVHCRDMFAKMLHSVYADLATLIKNEILRYVPVYRGYFFAMEAGNDKLLSLKSDDFLGSAFLSKPILYTEENHYKSCNEVFSFGNADEIPDPVSLYLLLNYSKELFLAPEKCNVVSYGIDVLKDAYFELFTRALQGRVHLKESLDVIDEAEASYLDLLKRLVDKKIQYEMLEEISKHPKCIRAINEFSIGRIKENKPVEIEVTHSVTSKNIKFIISEDEPIEMSDLDEVVVRYLKFRQFQYITAPLEKGQRYIVAKNTLILSSFNTLNAFAIFCRDVGKNDHFAATMTMRAASMRLNDADDSLSVPEYMKLLREVRNSIRQAFGKKHYESYIKVIRELNSDPQRFIRELLQNADDCHYVDGVVPCFALSIKGGTLVTEYNEVGFTKDNVRSITAIGESTKKQIHSGNFEIGEKGIGFKTVFSVAETVDIHSNDFHFQLAASTPTIPSIIPALEEEIAGTRMVFELRKHMRVDFSQEQILALCLCLRNLKDITINNIKITIEDVDDKRIIQIGSQKHVFDTYKHSYVVEDEQALLERNDGGKNISKEQDIVFYVPDRNIPKFTYYLYCGLPTSIEMGVPLAIDAPYELTASRDNVLQNKWNTRQRQEMYIAYAKVLQQISRKVRIKALQYVRFQALQFGSQIKFSLFKNDEDGWLADYNVLDLLKTCRFIPTYDELYFATPNETVYRYPAVAHTMLSDAELSVQACRKIIDDPTGAYDAALKNLNCKPVSFGDIANIIVERVSQFIEDEKFRIALYKYLSDTPEMRGQSALLKKASIIPVKGLKVGDGVNFVSYEDRDLYVDDVSSVSTSEYNVLATAILPKNQLERILDIDITIMDNRYRKSLYDEKLVGIITAPTSNANKYRTLLNELLRNRTQLMGSVGVLLQHQDEIPLLMENGEYRCGECFITTLDRGCFSGKVIKSHLVAKEATEFASLLQCGDIALVSYEALEIDAPLTDDDILDLLTPGIRYSYHILEQCMFDGFITEEQARDYGIEGLKRTDYGDVFDEDDFPNEPVKNAIVLRSRIAEQCRTARRIVKVQEIRTVDKVQLPNGSQQSLDSSGIRRETLKRYRPSSNTDGCFCQMCRRVKSTEYMEVNNIWSKPEYYWPQMRVSLCLDCSKKFEAMRQNRDIMNQFYDYIQNASVQASEAISIPIGNADIRFTQTHLAEIQEILKSDKK